MRSHSGYSRWLQLVLISGLISLSCDSSVSNVGGTGTVGGTPAGPATAFDVVTFHDDNARTGQDLTETLLTPDNVNQNSFGKVGFLVVDGKVDAQPLYLSNLNIPGQGVHPVVFVVTEQDTVYAFGVDSGQVFWRSSLLGPGETTSDPRGCPEEINPGIGATATPVIDRSKGPNGAIYVVGMSVDASGNYSQRLHALDVTTGAELFGGPRTVTASYPGTGENSVGGYVVFDPKQYKERAALLELNGVVYTTWASHCDQVPYTGWIMGFDASTLQQKSVLNVTPNGDHGGIWMSGSGPAADSSGNIYVLDGNGTFDSTLDANGFPSQGDFGNSFLKISTTGSTLKVADYFVMFNQSDENSNDMDLGSGGTVLIPDQTDSNGQTRHIAVGAGKDGNLYIADRDSMGKYNPVSDNIFQKLVKAFPGRVYSTPAYFNNVVYYGGEGDQVKAFSIKDAHLSLTPTSTSQNAFAYPGATPSISANGTSNGIVWAVENGYLAKLHAYDATNLSRELYNSGQAPYDRDQLGPGNKFITPTIANGKIFVGTTYGVTVYGLRQ
jgi:hypothetical protein